MRRIISAVVLLAVWACAAAVIHSPLLPSPLAVLREAMSLFAESDSYRHIAISFFRGILGLSLALTTGVLLGLPCGRHKTMMDTIAPLASAVQGCPTIVWITLVMVWAGVGGTVPITAVVVAAAPVIFLNTAQGVAALDRRLLVMAKLYQVPKPRIIADILLPGIAPYLLAGFAFAVGICWKVISTAEFIGSDTGIGTQIYWAYRNLNIPRLFCWALLLIMFSLVLDAWLISPLSSLVRTQRSQHND